MTNLSKITGMRNSAPFKEMQAKMERNQRNPLCVCGHSLSQHEKVHKESSRIHCGFCDCKEFRTSAKGSTE